MKYSAAMLSLAAAAAAQPAITNLAFDVVEGQPFTITFNGCEGGCTIILSNGASDDLQDVQELTSSASGGEFTFTPEELPSDQYAFEIINNETGENNYSQQFQYEGTAEEDDDSSSTTVIETTITSATTATVPVTETTTSEETTVATTDATTIMTTVTSVTETPTPTDSEDDEDDEEASSTAGETTSPTTIPDGAAVSMGSPLTLVAAAVAGLLMFN